MLLTEHQLIELFANAIAQEEEWFKTRRIQTVAQRCCNPGNLDHWRDPEGNPFPEMNGSVVFPTAEVGWKALRSQCRINILKRGLTWLEFFVGKPGLYKGFRPAGREFDQEKQNPVAYAHRVMERVCAPLRIEVGIRTPVKDLLTMLSTEERAEDVGQYGTRAA